MDTSLNSLIIQENANKFAHRQINRLQSVVGSNSITGPLIEEGYKTILHLLDKIYASNSYFFGTNPSSADFGLYGQLSQLALFDPTPSKIAITKTVRVVSWVQNFEDLSGWNDHDNDNDDTWITSVQDLQPAHLELLQYIGLYYLPFLNANYEAHIASQPIVACTLNGHMWTQNTFPYQAKCYVSLRSSYEALSNRDKLWLIQHGVKFEKI